MLQNEQSSLLEDDSERKRKRVKKARRLKKIKMEIEDQDKKLPHIPNQREGRGDVKYNAAGGRKETKDKARKEFKSERRARLEKRA